MSAARLPLRSLGMRTAVPSHGARSATAVMQSQRMIHASRVAQAVVVEDGKDPQLGDYPSPKKESMQSRRFDPRYWDKQEKRNFGETLHEQDDVLSVWAPDIHANVKPSSALLQLATAAAIFASFASLVYISLPDRPAQPRTYPRDGLAQELGSKEVAAYAEGDFDAKSGEEDEEEDDD